MQIGASAIVPYGMQTNATASAAARALEFKGPVEPVRETGRGEQRGDAWIDASWTEAPERPAHIDPYDSGDAGGALAFAAQSLAQQDAGSGTGSPAHQAGCAAYRAAQGGDGTFRRGDLGIDLLA